MQRGFQGEALRLGVTGAPPHRPQTQRGVPRPAPTRTSNPSSLHPHLSSGVTLGQGGRGLGGRMGNKWETGQGSRGNRSLPAPAPAPRESEAHSGPRPQRGPREPPSLSRWVPPTRHNGAHVPAWLASAPGVVWGQASRDSGGAPPPSMGVTQPSTKATGPLSLVPRAAPGTAAPRWVRWWAEG